MRLFVAVPLDEAARAAAERLSGRVRAALGADAKAFSFGRSETFHLTLKFLGEVADERAADVASAVRAAAASLPPFELVLGGFGAFPSMGHPRVLWLGLERGADELTRLATRVDEELAVLGFERETRPFSAHLTLARSRDRHGARGVAERLTSVRASALATVQVSSVIVYQSRLSPKGATHTPLAELPLLAR